MKKTAIVLAILLASTLLIGCVKPKGPTPAVDSGAAQAIEQDLQVLEAGQAIQEDLQALEQGSAEDLGIEEDLQALETS